MQAGSSGGLAIGHYLIPRIELCQLMILIPYRLRPQSKVMAVAVSDGQIVSGSTLSTAHIFKFLLIALRETLLHKGYIYTTDTNPEVLRTGEKENLI